MAPAVTQPEPSTDAPKEELGGVEGEVEIEVEIKVEVEREVEVEVEVEVKPSSAIAAALSVQPTNTPLMVFIGSAKHC